MSIQILNILKYIKIFLVEFLVHSKYSYYYRSYRGYTKEAFVNELNQIDWSIIDMHDDIDSAVDAWNSVFSDVINRHDPIRKTRIKGLHAPWITTLLSDAMRDRDFHHRKAIKITLSFTGINSEK